MNFANNGNNVLKTFLLTAFFALLILPAFVQAASTASTVSASSSDNSFLVPGLDKIIVNTVGLNSDVKKTTEGGVVSYSFPVAVKIKLYKNAPSWLSSFTGSADKYNVFKDVEVSVTKIVFEKGCKAALPDKIPKYSSATTVEIDLTSNKNSKKEVILYAAQDSMAKFTWTKVSQVFIPAPFCDPGAEHYFNYVKPADCKNQIPGSFEINWEKDGQKLLIPVYYLAYGENANAMTDRGPALATKIVFETPDRLVPFYTFLESVKTARDYFDKNCNLKTTDFLKDLCSHTGEHISTGAKGVKLNQKLADRPTDIDTTVSVYGISQEKKAQGVYIKSFEATASQQSVKMSYELSAKPSDATLAVIFLMNKLYDEKAIALFGDSEIPDAAAFKQKYAPSFSSVTLYRGAKTASEKYVYERSSAASQLYAMDSKNPKTKEVLEWKYEYDSKGKFFAGLYDLELAFGSDMKIVSLNLNEISAEKPKFAQERLVKDSTRSTDSRKVLYTAHLWGYYYDVVGLEADNKVVLEVIDPVGNRVKVFGAEDPLYFDAPRAVNDALSLVVTKAGDGEYVLTVYKGKVSEAKPVAPGAQPSGLAKRGEACTPTGEWNDEIAACVKQTSVNPTSCPNLAQYRGNCVETQKSEDGTKDYYLSCVKNLKPSQTAPDYICAAMYQVSSEGKCYAVDRRANTPSECVQPSSGKTLCLRPYDAQKKAAGVFYGSCSNAGTRDQEAGPSNEYCRVEIKFNDVDSDHSAPYISVNAEWLVTQASGANKAVLKLTYPSELSSAAGFEDDFATVSRGLGYPDLKVGSKQTYPLTYAVSKRSAAAFKSYLASKSGSFSGFKFKLVLSKEASGAAAQSVREIDCVLTGSLNAKPAPKLEKAAAAPEGGYCEAFDDPVINLDGARTWGKLYQIVDMAGFFSIIPSVTVSKLLGYGPRAYVTQIDYYLADAPTGGRTPSELQALVFPYGRWININKLAVLYPWAALAFWPTGYTPISAVIYTTPGGGNGKTTTAFFISYSPFAWHRMPDINVGSHAIWKQGNVVSVFYPRGEYPVEVGASSGVSTQGRTTTASVTESVSFTKSLFNTWCPMADDRDCSFVSSAAADGEHTVRIAVTQNDFENLGLQDEVNLDVIAWGPQITDTAVLTKGTECVFGSSGKLECSIGPDSAYAWENTRKFLRFKFKDSSGKVVVYSDCVLPNRDVTAPAAKKAGGGAQAPSGGSPRAPSKTLEEQAACKFKWYDLFLPGEYTGGIYPVKISFNTPNWNVFNPPYQYGFVQLTYNSDGDYADFPYAGDYNGYLLQKTMQRADWFESAIADSATAKLFLYKYKEAMESRLDADAVVPCAVEKDAQVLECIVNLADNNVHYYAAGDLTDMVRKTGALVLSYTLDGEDQSVKLAYFKNDGYSAGYLKLPDYVNGKLGDATDFELWTFKNGKSAAPVGFDNLRIEGDTYLHVKCKTA